MQVKLHAVYLLISFSLCPPLSRSCPLSGSIFALLSLLSGSGSPKVVLWCPAEPVQSHSFSLPAHHEEASEDSRRASSRPVVPEPGETEEPQRHLIRVRAS